MRSLFHNSSVRQNSSQKMFANNDTRLVSRPNQSLKNNPVLASRKRTILIMESLGCDNGLNQSNSKKVSTMSDTVPYPQSNLSNRVDQVSESAKLWFLFSKRKAFDKLFISVTWTLCVTRLQRYCQVMQVMVRKITVSTMLLPHGPWSSTSHFKRLLTVLIWFQNLDISSTTKLR